jgi:hypothetical protein
MISRTKLRVLLENGTKDAKHVKQKLSPNLDNSDGVKFRET